MPSPARVEVSESRHDRSRLDWHGLDDDQVLRRLGTDRSGLASAEVQERLSKHGRNELPSRRQVTLAEVFLHQFLSPLIYVLLAAGTVALALAEFADALFIFAVLLFNAVIGTYQEYRAEKSAVALQSLIRSEIRVRRDGRQATVDSVEVVPGDIVLIESGNRIPADARLLDSHELRVDESALTGESVAVEKADGALPVGTGVSDRRNMVFAGTSATFGRGTAVVVATGANTEVGRIAHGVSVARAGKPPLLIRMERFARRISYVVLGLSLVLAVVALWRGMPLTEVFFTVVALAVSAIPEGLPVALTVALAVASARMARRHVVVRRLAAVESLGSCTLIASDKTGTLTVNRQTAKQILLPNGVRLDVTGEGYAGEGEVLGPDGAPLGELESRQAQRLARAAAICNEAVLERGGEEEGGWRSHGDAMDVAFLALGYKLGLDGQAVRSGIEVLQETPYESARRYAAAHYRDREGLKVAVKGATDVLLPHCQWVWDSTGERRPIDIGLIELQANRLAEEGYRLLMVAEGPAEGELQLEKLGELPGLAFLGLVGFIDPLRPSAREAVAECRRAGVEVAMITGDHPVTAKAIARQLGLVSGEVAVVTGRQLEEAGDHDSPRFRELVADVRVFARVTPMQKVEIVEAFRTEGHFVAVTGDGVNDAPALRRANIGVAMGSGTDVAKDTASMIVANDDFASIVAGVEEGRYAYDNVRKVTYLLISTGFAEVLAVLLALAMGLPLPFLAVQLLWLNLVTNGIQDVALAFEKGEPGAMRRPPRRPGEGILDSLMVQQTLAAGTTIGLLAFGLWSWLMVNGWQEDQARNLVLVAMVLMQNTHVFNCRSERTSAFRVPLANNWLLVGGVAAAQLVHLLAMRMPVMQEVLGVSPVALGEWLLLLGLALVVLVVMEVFKWVKRSQMRAGATQGG